MNSKQAKQIPLWKILLCLGYEPVVEKNSELLYYSPFRKEKNPSFFLNKEKNVWHDFGRGEGGNVLDFIMTYYSIVDVSTALKQLDELVGFPQQQIRPVLFFPTPIREESEFLSKLYMIEKIQSLQNKVLIQYLKARGIKKQVASLYLKEIYYSVQKRASKKRYFVLAFPNLSGGYELRNPLQFTSDDGKFRESVKFD